MSSAPDLGGRAVDAARASAVAGHALPDMQLRVGERFETGELAAVVPIDRRFEPQ